MSLKKSIRKLTALMVAMLIVHSNCYMFGVGLSKVIAQDIKEPNINLSLENTQYVQFSEELKQEDNAEGNQEKEKQYNSGVAVKTNLQISLEEQETSLPIKGSEIVISMPNINGCLPERASVVNANTALTTGEINNQKINQNYDSNSGLLTISYENEETSTNYNNESKDEFEIIYIYPAQAYTENEEEISLQYSVVAKVNFETENSIITSEKAEGFELNEKENKGSLLTFGITQLENNIYKGFMYSNVENGNNYDTNYNTISTLCILDKNTTNEFTMKMEENKFILNDNSNTEIMSEGNLLHRAMQISKTEFDKILGQDGCIEIYEEETLLATLKYVEISENEEIVKKLAIIYSDEDIRMLSQEETNARIEFGEGVKSVIIKTTKPISEGYINFKNENTIKGADDYIVEVAKIKSIKTTSIINENTENAEIILQEPETKVDVNSSNINFSTLQTSKTTLTVKLDSTNPSTKLFNNPTITIKLPEGLKNGNLSSPEIVNGNGLTIKEATAFDNVITIKLEGKQTSYDLTNVSGGTSLVMDIENIDFEDTLPTHTDKIEVTCSQNKETVKASKEVNIISKEGLLILSNITSLEDNQTLTSIDNETKFIEVQNNADAKELVQTINLVNNYNNKITNTQILGKIGYINEELNSTFDLELTKPIEVKNGKVYYSTNKEALYNDETWTEEFSNQVKAYKIELENSELEEKANTEIKLYFSVQANLEYNQETYAKTEINYECNGQNINDSTSFGIVTPKNDLTVYSTEYNAELTTETGNNIPVSVIVTPNITKEFVHSGQTVTYNVKVTNNGKQELNNIKVEDIIPENAIYTYEQIIEDETATYKEITKDNSIKNKEWNIETLKPNESVNYEIMLTMADVTEEQETLNKIKLTSNQQELTAESKLIIKPAKVITTLETDGDSLINLKYDYADTVKYYLKVKNTTDEKLKNLKVKFNLPELLEYINGGEAEFDKFEGYILNEKKPLQVSGNSIEYTIDKLKKQEEVTLVVYAKVKELTDTLEAQIDAISQVELDNDIYESNLNTIETAQSSIFTSLMSNVDSKTVLKQNDEVIYTINVQNVGPTSGIVTIQDNIPEQLEVNRIEEYVNNELTISMDTVKQNIVWDAILEQEEKLTLKIYTNVAKIELENVTNIDVKNSATVKFVNKEILANEVGVIIQSELKANTDEIEPEDEGIRLERLDNNDSELEDEFDDDDIYISGESQSGSGSSGNSQGGTGSSGSNQGGTSSEGNDQGGTGSSENNQGGTGSSDQNQDGSSSSGNKNEETETKYSISGVAWLDLDKNGKRDNNETLLSNITVNLINANSGDFALDANGNKIKTTTDAQGKYIFSNIEKGSYTVMFEYDTNNYTVTTYRKEGIEESINSDVILSSVSIDGQTKKVGITDKIELSSNKENIDLGLIQNAIFDLSLNKQITKITVVDKQGTENYEYKDGHTAKVDLVAKYMNGANVLVTYKFTIKNEGDVVGYVNSLVDTLPSGLEFNSEMNTAWYKDSDGKLYTTSLSGIGINPGESKEIELVLTKTMTEENAGTFPNSAKLEKISNLENISEKETAKENNESSAILIISIKTGSIILYIGITLMCLAIIGLGAYFINKKVLNKEI